MSAFIVVEEEAPGPCRHCTRFVRWEDDALLVGGEITGAWIDIDGSTWCRPGLLHEGLPDWDDLKIELAWRAGKLDD